MPMVKENCQPKIYFKGRLSIETNPHYWLGFDTPSFLKTGRGKNRSFWSFMQIQDNGRSLTLKGKFQIIQYEDRLLFVALEDPFYPYCIPDFSTREISKIVDEVTSEQLWPK